ncbi:suppressor of fused domain protein [Streptomyces sedi]|uniref:Suppressor of fused domain protein n=1 Tax=Streptomyces sedi TaxID=555059 RepID=A0A5C4VCM4_9ACTN|nr:suppressor of fused domain protein [Streptomyces sedi]TNM33638.1 suppressor of fused domain protein [Streptomyces sedi]
MVVPLDDPYYTALHDHAQRYLGPGYARVAPVGDDGFGMGLHRDDRARLVSALTLGVPFQPGVDGPVEFACTLQASQEREAHHLARVAARWFIASGESAEFGAWIQSEAPMVPDTGIHGLLFDTHPLVGEAFSVLADARWPDQPDRPDQPHGPGAPAGALRLVVLLPLTAAEIDVLESPEQGREDLWERWRAEKTRLWDVERAG